MHLEFVIKAMSYRFNYGNKLHISKYISYLTKAFPFIPTKFKIFKYKLLTTVHAGPVHFLMFCFDVQQCVGHDE